MWGANFALGLGYGSSQRWEFKPSAGLSNRSKLNADTAIVSSVNVSASLRTAEDAANGYSFHASVGPLFQLTDSLALNADVGVNVSNSDLTVAAVSASTSPDRSTMVPLSFGLDHRMAKQWGLMTSYSYLGLGSSDWSANIVILKLTHYW